jgi:hypothetical protein
MHEIDTERHYKTKLSDYIILTFKAFPQNEQNSTHVQQLFFFRFLHNMLKSSKNLQPN